MTGDPDEDGLSALRQVAWTEVGDDWDQDGLEDADLSGGVGDDPDPEDPAGPSNDDQPPGEAGYQVVRIPRSMRGRLVLPQGCPVTPLGVLDDKYFYLDRIGQLRRVSAEKHGQNTLKSLFGDTSYLLLNWPRAKQTEDGTWEATGWRPEECGSALMDACMRKGVFDPDERVRGAGAWKGAAGELIIHFGKGLGVWPADGSAVQWFEPCEMGDWIYPTRPIMPLPAKAETAIGAGAEVLSYFRSWNWARPDVDPQLLLGWVVAAFLGASLKWHPLYWSVGDRGSGKSTLLLMIYCLLGKFMLKIENASSAYIYQKVGRDSRAVGIDEAEPDEESSRQKQQLELARAAASGASIGRGGADGTPVEFTQRAPWLFCSINMPPLNGADLSRIAVGSLGRLEGFCPPVDATVPPEEDEAVMARVMTPLGRRLLRQIVDGWGRFPAVLKAYRQAMKDAGHGGRGADLFGTQLACAHLVLSAAMPSEQELRLWGERLKASELAELSNDLATNRACLLHLQSSLLDAKKGGQSYTVGYWVTKLVENLGSTADASDSAVKDVRDILRAHGLDVRPAPVAKGDRPPLNPPLYLWVANRHQGVARIFDGSAWKTRSGAAGPWTRQIATLPGAVANVSFFVDGAQDKAVLVPIHYCQESPPEGGQDNMPAAGGSPVAPPAARTLDAGASHRSAAGAAFPDPSASSDPFSLSEDF